MKTFFINNEGAHMGKDHYKLAQELLVECATCLQWSGYIFRKDAQTLGINLTEQEVTAAFKRAKIDFDLKLLDCSLDFLQLNLMYYHNGKRIIRGFRIDLNRNSFCVRGSFSVDVSILFSDLDEKLDDWRAEIIEKFLPKKNEPAHKLVFVCSPTQEHMRVYIQELLKLLLADWAAGDNILDRGTGDTDSLLIPDRHLIPAIQSAAKIDYDFCEFVTDGDGLDDQGEADLSELDLEEFYEDYLVNCCYVIGKRVKVDYNGKRIPLFTDWGVTLTRTHCKSKDEPDLIEFKQDCKVLFTTNLGLYLQKIAQDVLDSDGNFKPNRLIDTD